jgi:hypothetical protein
MRGLTNGEQMMHVLMLAPTYNRIRGGLETMIQGLSVRSCLMGIRSVRYVSY